MGGAGSRLGTPPLALGPLAGTFSWTLPARPGRMAVARRSPAFPRLQCSPIRHERRTLPAGKRRCRRLPTDPRTGRGMMGFRPGGGWRRRQASNPPLARCRPSVRGPTAPTTSGSPPEPPPKTGKRWTPPLPSATPTVPNGEASRKPRGASDPPDRAANGAPRLPPKMLGTRPTATGRPVPRAAWTPPSGRGAHAPPATGPRHLMPRLGSRPGRSRPAPLDATPRWTPDRLHPCRALGTVACPGPRPRVHDPHHPATAAKRRSHPTRPPGAG